MVTGSGEATPTAPPGSSPSRPRLTDGLGLRLDTLLPSRRWVVVAESADQGRRSRELFWADEPTHAQVVVADGRGWERRLRGLGPRDGILVHLPRAGWARCARILVAARLHPGPLVLVEEGGDPNGPLERRRHVLLATSHGDVRARVFRSYREELKSADPGPGRRLLQLRVSGGAPEAGVGDRDEPEAGVGDRDEPEAGASGRAEPGAAGRDMPAPGGPQRQVVDLSRFNPLGRRPGGAAGVQIAADALDAMVEEITLAERLPEHVEVAPSAAHIDRELARAVVELAALGVPVRFRAGPPDLPGVSPALRDELRRASRADLRDPWTQELLSVRLRRAAMRDHGALPGGDAAGRPPGAPPHRVPVSVVLASNRADHVHEAVERIVAQHHRPLELVVAAHGVDVGLETERDGVPITVVRVAADANLGEVLDAGTAASSGSVIVKMDDDDLYAPSHVTDLVLALRFSGATVAGKAAEFIYLGPLDVTVRRGLASERFGGHVAGGTIAIHRSDLVDVGGWAPVPRAVDTRLLDAVQRAGGSVYRTHGFGFVLNRHQRGHAFEVGDARYLRRTVGQRAGLDLRFAGVDEDVVDDG